MIYDSCLNQLCLPYPRVARLLHSQSFSALTSLHPSLHLKSRGQKVNGKGKTSFQRKESRQEAENGAERHITLDTAEVTKTNISVWQKKDVNRGKNVEKLEIQLCKAQSWNA